MIHSFFRWSALSFLLVHSFVVYGIDIDLDKEIKKTLKYNDPTIILPNEMSGYSFDPLEALFTKNLRLIRLLYETPVRYDKNGFIYSNILQRFTYLPDKKTLSFYLKRGIRFSDNSELTIYDLSLAIKRMLLARPDHPVIDKIAGGEVWRKRKHPLEHLPEGIKIKNNCLTIKFTEKVSQVLNWFTHETFSIIPEHCVDKKTSQMKCKIPPFSGEYDLTQSYVPFFAFKRRNTNNDLPETIRFIHISPVRLIKFLDDYKDNHVIVTDEIFLPQDHRKIIETRFRQHFIPESRFMALYMNKNVPPFNNVKVRQYLAREYRKTLNSLFGKSDGGIFTRMMPGYISSDVLSTRVPSLTHHEQKEVLDILKKHPPRWRALVMEVDHDPFQFYLTKTLNRLGLPVSKPIENIKGKESYLHAWNTGKININRFYSGFTGPDPTEDFKMVFSKNMFYILEDLYHDNYLQNLIKKIDHTSIGELNTQNLENISFHLFEQAILAPVVNYTVAQYTLKDSPLQIVNDNISDPTHYFMK